MVQFFFHTVISELSFDIDFEKIFTKKIDLNFTEKSILTKIFYKWKIYQNILTIYMIAFWNILLLVKNDIKKKEYVGCLKKRCPLTR